MTLNDDPLLPGLWFGCLPFAFGTYQVCRELIPRFWQQTTGKVLLSNIETRQTTKGSVVIPQIEYEYSFNGQTFKSSLIRAGSYISGTRNYAEAAKARYPIGCNVKVFVSRRNPEKACLEYGITPMSLIFIAVGLVLIMTSLLPLVVK
jgi:hypothetical protein